MLPYTKKYLIFNMTKHVCKTDDPAYFIEATKFQDSHVSPHAKLHLSVFKIGFIHLDCMRVFICVCGDKFHWPNVARQSQLVQRILAIREKIITPHHKI